MESDSLNIVLILSFQSTGTQCSFERMTEAVAREDCKLMGEKSHGKCVRLPLLIISTLHPTQFHL